MWWKKLVFPCENRLQISVSFNHGISIGNKAWERKWLPQFKRHAFSIIVFQGCIPRGSYFENGKNINTCKSNHRSWRKSLWRPFDNHFAIWQPFFKMKFKMPYFGAPILVKQRDETWSLMSFWPSKTELSEEASTPASCNPKKRFYLW